MAQGAVTVCFSAIMGPSCLERAATGTLQQTIEGEGVWRGRDVEGHIDVQLAHAHRDGEQPFTKRPVDAQEQDLAERC